MYKNISILGSTGSIGTQALKISKKLGVKVVALTANKNISLLEQQIRQFSPNFVAVVDEKAAADLKIRVADTNTRVYGGKQALIQAACHDKAEAVLNAIVGMAGLVPTLTAVEAGKDIALANKETLVAGGSLVMEAAKKKGVKILPVDSEHSAIFQCLQSDFDKSALKRIILTASGGPFFGKSKQELESVTPAQALKHPNWSMGAKITIDSATMMNKGLELIEAVWLFSVKPDQVDIVIHRQSVIHSLVEFVDNSVIAQLGVPDMAIPIQYALTYPQRHPCDVKALSLTDYKNLTFEKPDYDTFVCMDACRQAIEQGGVYPAAVNGANEAAVEMFLKGKIKFLQIGELVLGAMQNQSRKDKFNLNDVLEADAAAKEYVISKIN